MNADGSGQRRLTHLAAHNSESLPGCPTGSSPLSASTDPTTSRSTSSTPTGAGSGTCHASGDSTTLSGLEPGRAEDRLREQARWQLGALRDERRRERAAEPDAQRGERLPLWRSIPGRPTGGSSSLNATATATAAATHIYVINADGSGERKLTRGRQPRLVTRRAEDHLHEQARKLGRDLRHERRRQRTAEADTQPGENGQRENGQRLACLVTRAEVERASGGTRATSPLLTSKGTARCASVPDPPDASRRPRVDRTPRDIRPLKPGCCRGGGGCSAVRKPAARVHPHGRRRMPSRSQRTARC